MNADWIRTDFKPVDKRDGVHLVQGWLFGDSRTRPVVLDGKRPFGIPNKRAFMGGRIQEREKIDHYTLPTPVLNEHMSHFDAIKAFCDTLAPYLPVGDGDGARGYVAALDVCAVVEDGPTAGEAAVRVPLLKQDDRMGNAVNAFRTEPVDELPVVDDRARMVGVLQRSAVLRLEHERLVGMGKVDFRAESEALLKDPVQGYTEDAWQETPAATDYEALCGLLEETEHVFVPDVVDAATGQKALRVVTPAFLARSAYRAHGEGWTTGRRGEGELAQRKPSRIASTPVRARQMNRH